MDIKLGKRYGYQVPVLEPDGTPKVNDKGLPVMGSIIEMLAIKPGNCDLTYTDKDGEHALTLIEPNILPSAD